MSQQPFNSDGGFSTTGNIAANYILGNGSQLTGVASSYGNADVAVFLADYGSNTVSTTGNITAGNFVGAGTNVDIVAGAYDWAFDNTGNLTAPGIITANTFVSNAFNVVTAGNLFISSQYGLGTTGTILEDNGTLELVGGGANGCVVVGWNSTYGTGLGPVSQIYFNPVGSSGNAVLTTGNIAGTSYNWTFDNNGTLILPNNTVIKDTSDAALAIGVNAGTGGSSAISIGTFAGNTNQSYNGIAIGGSAGANAQGGGAMAIGLNAGYDQQGPGAIAIGSAAGQYSQGELAVAIGPNAGTNNQASRSIILNASDITLDTAIANSFSVNPVRNDTGNTTNALYYNTSTYEITYGPAGGAGSYGNANVAAYLPTYSGNLANLGGDVNTSGNVSASGNVTAGGGAYFIGDGSLLTNLPSGGSYGNANVSAFLGAYGSNTVSTTGNITSGNIIATANVLGNGYARLTGSFDESQASTAGLYLGYAGGTARIMFGTGNTSQTFEIDNDGGNLRFYQPGSTKAILTSGGVFSAAGNVTGANLTTASNVAFTANAGQINFNTGAFISGNANSITRDGSIVLSPYTGAGSTFPGVVIGGAGRLLAPNGSVHQIFNTSDVTTQVASKITVGTVSTSTSTGALQVSGGVGVTGNIYVGGNTTTGNNAIVAGVTGTLLANSTASFFANVNSYTQITYQNRSTGADATADFILTADNGNDSVNYSDFGIINSGYDNSTPTNSLGNIVFAADTYLYAQGNVGNTSQAGGNLAIGTSTAGKTVKIFAGGVTSNAIVANISNTGIAVTGAVSATGNITAQNFIGNISITGNVTGTSSNVTLVAGSYSTVFDNTGVATFPGFVKAVELTSTNSVGNEGGQINLAIPAANTTLGGTTVTVDVYQNQLRFFEGSANAKGAYIDLSSCANGVGTNLVNRASIIAAANTKVTLNNITAQVGGSPTRLYIGTVTSNLTVAGDSQTMTSGSLAVGSWINVPIVTGAGNEFAMSGALTSNGDTAILSLIDQGTGTGMWRITGMIANTTANLYGVTIERLV